MTPYTTEQPHREHPEYPSCLRGCALPLVVSIWHVRLRSAVLAGKVGIWDTATGQCKHMLEGPSGTIEWAQWHPKGDVILAGSDDFTAWLWNAQTGTCMQVQSPAYLKSTCSQLQAQWEAEETVCHSSGRPWQHTASLWSCKAADRSV